MSERTHHQRSATIPVRLLACGVLVFLAACEQDEAASPAAVPITVPGSASQVITDVGTASVAAVAIQTSQLPAVVAAEHGIEQRDDLVMLRVSPREGVPGSISTAPAAVRATVTDLRGRTREIELEERVINGLVDHVGTVEISLPETLRFNVAVVGENGETESFDFSREFRAR